MTAPRGDDRRAEQGHFELSLDERLEVIAAAYARLFETRRYLRDAEAFTSNHSDCCNVAQARAGVIAEQKRDLEKREETLVKLLDKLEDGR